MAACFGLDCAGQAVAVMADFVASVLATRQHLVANLSAVPFVLVAALSVGYFLAAIARYIRNDDGARRTCSTVA